MEGVERKAPAERLPAFRLFPAPSAGSLPLLAPILRIAIPMTFAPTPGRGSLGAILAGGASRRFGSPKALARVGGRTIAERVRDALAEGVDDVVVIANEPELFAGLALPARADDVPGLGALGGIVTALRWARAEGRPGALCVACDMPFVAPALLRAILAAADDPEVDAVVPESRGRRGVEPLCAWYSVRALQVAETMAASEERALHVLVDRLKTKRIPLSEVERVGDPELLFLNVNTVEDHGRAMGVEDERSRANA